MIYFVVLLFQHVEQGKHRLRLQIEIMEEEYEQRIADLKADLVKLRKSLDQVEKRNRDRDRERQGLISQLSEQNQRLTNRLENASKREGDLTRRLQELRVQFNDKRTSIRDHVNHLENLNQEVNERANERTSSAELTSTHNNNNNNTLLYSSDVREVRIRTLLVTSIVGLPFLTR